MSDSWDIPWLRVESVENLLFPPTEQFLLGPVDQCKKKEHVRFRSAVMLGLTKEIHNKRGCEKPEEPVFRAKNTLNSGKGQQTNQKYRNLVNSDRQMERLELKVNLERLTVRLGLTVIQEK